MTKPFIKNSFSWLFSFLWRSRYDLQIVGSFSRVAFWRVRPFERNRLSVGTQSIVETKIFFERVGARVLIGDRTFIGAGTMTVADEIQIGNDVMIAWGVVVSDHNSHSVIFSKRRNDVVEWLKGKKDWSDVIFAPVKISDKAWIGFNSIILKGVSVGEGAVVGAGSVVTKDVPPWTVVAGNPARIIREIPENER